MKELLKYASGVAIGIVVTLVILSFIKGCINYEINIIDTLMLIITTALTIAVVYLGNSLNKRDVARDIISKDLMELCDVYSRNMSILEQLSKGEISLDDAKTDIRMTFHRGDVISDMILEEIKESFPKFMDDKNAIQNLATSYWKWLTDGDMQEANFVISQQFLKEHENIREAIKEEFFTPGGRLLTEARLLLMMELRAVDMYESILYLIARGNNEVSNISSKSGKDKAVVSQALANLARLGITKRREPFEGVGVAKGWIIEDGYFLFFYKYVFPYISSIEFDAGDAAFNSAVSDIDTFTGREMEKVFRRYILTSYIRPVSKIAGIEFPNPKSKQNEEIDLVALIPPDAMLFGECKWKRAKVDISVYNLLQRRAEMAYPKVKNKFYSILSRSGYEDNLIKLADTIDNLLLLTPEVICTPFR